MTEERTVLFVDDDEIILRSIKMGLSDEPYNQLFCKSGHDALEILQKEHVHVIVTDMLMPDMDGIELLKIVRDKYPDIVKIVLSGYIDNSALQKEFNLGEIFKVIPKPWKVEKGLKEVVLEAIDHYNIQSEQKTVGQMS
jgi:two-component system response regulator HupR/HoxA